MRAMRESWILIAPGGNAYHSGRSELRERVVDARPLQVGSLLVGMGWTIQGRTHEGRAGWKESAQRGGNMLLSSACSERCEMCHN